ncbi:unnamed protein product, partial [Gulo gulo]
MALQQQLGKDKSDNIRRQKSSILLCVFQKYNPTEK